VETHLALASMRDVRAYDGAPLPEAVALRILDAGRLAGSARNRQPTRFAVVEGDALPGVARAVYVSRNIITAGLVVAVVVSPGGNMVDFDAGRAAQSMMLSAWADGIASCPNGIADAPALERALGVESPERVAVVLSFGAPENPRDPARRSAEEWSARARRLPLEDVVRRVGAVGP
jgi:nitroreductase